MLPEIALGYLEVALLIWSVVSCVGADLFAVFSFISKRARSLHCWFMSDLSPLALLCKFEVD